MALAHKARAVTRYWAYVDWVTTFRLERDEALPRGARMWVLEADLMLALRGDQLVVIDRDTFAERTGTVGDLVVGDEGARFFEVEFPVLCAGGTIQDGPRWSTTPPESTMPSEW